MGQITYANKSAINENARVAATNKVQAADMNEIKSAVNDNNTKITNIKGAVLWTNPTPNLSFANQTITLSSSDYDTLEIFYRSTPSFSNYRGSIRMLKGGSGEITLSDTGTFDGTLQNCIILRSFSYSSDTQYNVSKAQYRYGTTGSYEVTDILVPLYVVGYKTGLFS